MSELLNQPRAERLLQEAGVDVLVATTFQNVYYLSGYQSFGQRFLPTTQVYAVSAAETLTSPVVIAPIGDADMYAQFPAPNATMRFYGRFFVEQSPDLAPDSLTDEMRRFLDVAMRTPGPSAVDALIAELDRYPASARIAVDERGIAPAARETLADRYGQRLVAGADLFDRIRMVKTGEEIRRLTRAVEVIESSYLAALAAVREGMTEEEMAKVFDCNTILHGCTPIFTVIAFGERSALPNAVPGQRRLRPGDIIRFDIGCRAEGYCSDISRTAVFGRPSGQQQSRYAAILEGEVKALEMLRPGVPARAIFAAGIQATQQAGIPEYRRQHVGHGIGLDVYDHPVLNEVTETQLEPGMVFEVETPYYEIGLGGLQVEDTVVVTESGYTMLTQTSRNLTIVG